MQESIEKNRKLLSFYFYFTNSNNFSREFKYSGLSTEKSRSKEVINRLALEKKLRDETIHKYTEIANKQRITKSPGKNG